MRELTQVELLQELEPVAESNLNRHLSQARDWHPHDYVPWDDGRNFAAMGGEDWGPEQSQLSDVAKAAMVLNVLTEDNLPSYHREISEYFDADGAWRTWVGRWTAEENRHAIVMRDYLVVTRGVDPVALENDRMANMTKGVYTDDSSGLLPGLAYVTIQELGTRISHRNTGKACDDPVADRMLQRIAADENLHMIFYRNLCSAAFDLAPDQAMEALDDVIERFQMPGIGMPNFRKMSLTMAKYGIYDLRQHLDDVLWPVLRKLEIFERTDFTGRGEQARDSLAAWLAKSDEDATRFEEQRDRLVARDAKRREKAAS
ncbi:acyl-[acyl-carrier-protein] desaturase DesA1 [Gordonia araii NBRC 100433]|uniref:Acyl-[acyl-carrier-protein] desaturase DesA1 n=1 Tax=Gordonia araii NBRC 100433 TaxID=1073574 RepID=G7H6H5_9ACTN|nr:acyl-ACP desaturase [Gordonia araii]NNG96130.1 acyl-ACP desaturase [Gordonia araii NBRC 100433]GAB11450.1 acyl-[acyl-carrier-protein] desaturase DesA1 [Gordonia araii NBRC 100433]